jgi:hypothetical protein
VLLALASGSAHGQAETSDSESSDSNSDSTIDAAPQKRRTIADAMKVPGTSSRLFYMPVADTVGAYEATISYEGSLLEERGVLSSAGVFALGIGNLAQIDYRHTSAIGVDGGSVPLPAVGVQLKLPIDTGEFVPAIAVAYRLGIEHDENGAKEKATDVYGVAHFALPLDVDLHVGLRVTQASLAFEEVKVESTEWYPAIGVVRNVGETAAAILEFGRAPKFDLEDGMPEISSGVTGRLGLRWRIHKRFSLDASAGYLAKGIGADPNDLLAWDIRLGGEVFVPWGAVACESLSLFCK